MRSRTRPVLAFACAASALACVAQQRTFEQFNTKEGLAQSQVRCMVQDRKGYLWFGTLGGVSRFDGMEFRNHALRGPSADPQVTALHVDRQGTLWLAAGRALLRWNGRAFLPIDPPPGLQGARIVALCDGPGSQLVVGTEERGVFQLSGGEATILPGCVADSVPGIRILLPDAQGNVLIGSKGGLWRSGASGFERIVLDKSRQESVSALAFDANGTLWAGTYGNGLFAIDRTGAIRAFSEATGLLQNNVRCVQVDDRGRVWVGSKFGLNVVDGDRIRAFTVHQGLPNDNIFCALRDDLGQLWFGTDGAGVLRYTGDAFTTFTTSDGLCSDLVMSITPDPQGDLWLGTYGTGICRLDAMAQVTTLDGLPNNTVWAGALDRKGRSWFGTSNGLCRLVSGMVVRLPDERRWMDQRVFSFHEDRDSTMWCGQRDGLSEVDARDSVRFHPSGSSGPGRSIRDIEPDADGRLWMATDEGLSVLAHGSFARMTSEDGLCDDMVLCLARDRRGRLWAGTSNGLSCIANGRPTTRSLGEEYGSNYIDALIRDPDGILWAGTNNGLFAFDPDSFLIHPDAYRSFDRSDGLRSVEFNLNAAYLDASGKAYFGTSAGLLSFDPRMAWAKAPSRDLPIHITGVRSFLQETDWRDRCDSIDPGTGLPLGLHLAYRRNYLTFDYGAINTQHPQRTRYRYRLLGYDADWLPPTDARFASYSNLTHGAYVFEVVASEDGREWSTPASFSFRIEPPFWLRWWFFLLCALGMAAMAYGVLRIRAARRERREKTRQLLLRSRMLQLEQQALNAHMNRHFVFNALNSIQYYINRQDRTAANRYLTSFAKLIRKNLDASQNDTTTLAEELERLELYLVLEHMRFKDKFRYDLDVDPAAHVSRVRIPAMMLQPYVENSIWHGILPMSRQGVVTISAHETGDGHIRVRIHDDGIGVDRSKSAKTPAAGDHISRGIEITKGRADVLRRLGLTDIRIVGPEQMHAPNGTVTGTLVTILLPVTNGMESGSSQLQSPTDAITFDVQ